MSLRLAVLVNGLPGAGKSTLAPQLATALHLPLIRKDAVKETLADTLGCMGDPAEWSRRLGAAASETMWTLLAESPIGAVVEGPYFGATRAPAIAALTRAAARTGETMPLHEVWCDVPVDLAQERTHARMALRHPIHRDDTVSLARKWHDWSLSEVTPLAVGPVYRIDTSMPVSAAEIVELAAKIRSNSGVDAA